MITGTTKTGFKYSVDEAVFDDWDFYDALHQGTVYGEIDAAKLLLDDEQFALLKGHCRGENGRVSMQKMDAEIGAIVSGAAEQRAKAKNS